LVCPIEPNGVPFMDERFADGKSLRARAIAPFCVLLCIGVAASLMACSSGKKTKPDQLGMAQIIRWLPGTYNNTAQRDADIKAGKAPHDALAVAIVPIDSPIMGAHAFYFQEMAADDPRRVMVQEILTFEMTDKGSIKESIAAFVEPRRWRDANLNPDVLTALVPDDLTQLSGCDLFWTRVPDGFVGANEPLRCHTASQSSEAAARTDLRAELSATELSLSERSYDASGQLTAGRADEPFYRLHKSALHKP
jgi:CpeT/CpcT family (DUF1001)